MESQVFIIGGNLAACIAPSHTDETTDHLYDEFRQTMLDYARLRLSPFWTEQELKDYYDDPYAWIDFYEDFKATSDDPTDITELHMAARQAVLDDFSNWN